MKYLFETQTEKFTLDPKLNPDNYRITQSLSGIGRWKAKIITGNSMGERNNVGDWDDVGYVGINITNNHIIPIARSDEHHEGRDLIYDLNINDDNYVTLFNGNNYIHSPDVKDKYLAAIKKWLAYGGPDNILLGSYNYASDTSLLFSQFVKYGGMVEIKKGKISPVGEELIRLFDELAEALHISRDDEFNKRKSQTVFLKFKSLMVFVNRLIWKLPGDLDEIAKQINNELSELRKNDDTRRVEELVFGMNGLKNIIHNALRGKDYRSDSVRIFGDIKLAILMLGKY